MTGLSDEDLESSLDTLREMARRLEATCHVLRERVVTTENGARTAAEVLVRKVPDDQQCIELRVCVLGSADVGKSTLLGVLTQVRYLFHCTLRCSGISLSLAEEILGEKFVTYQLKYFVSNHSLIDFQGRLDDGRGRARLNMFRHLHEVQTGRTSSVSHELLGFDSDGKPVDYSRCGTAEEICESSVKLITFIDLAGHRKYLRTTISGLTAHAPHYVMLVVSAAAGADAVNAAAEEHLDLAVALEVPFFVAVTKVDVAPRARVAAALESLQRLLKSAGRNKVPLVVRSGDDSITAAGNALRDNVVPVFCVSSVTGAGLDAAKRFLHLLPPGASPREQEKLEQERPEFQVDELFDVPDVGVVAGGLVSQGIVTEGMRLLAGPSAEDGSFRPVTVLSIKRNRAPCRLVRATQSAALALDCPMSWLRRGMCLVDPRAEAVACLYFQVRQSCQILEIIVRMWSLFSHLTSKLFQNYFKYLFFLGPYLRALPPYGDKPRLPRPRPRGQRSPGGRGGGHPPRHRRRHPQQRAGVGPAALPALPGVHQGGAEAPAQRGQDQGHRQGHAGLPLRAGREGAGAVMIIEEEG